MANIMKDVAKLLGLELEEEFTIEGFEDFFPKVKLTERGLSYWSNIDRRWCSLGDIPTKLLTGENKITKLPKPILDDVEKEYLSAVIKPFRNRVISIRKYRFNQDEYIGMYIKYYAETDKNEMITLPVFKEGTIYKGMKLNREYLLEELGL